MPRRCRPDRVPGPSRSPAARSSARARPLPRGLRRPARPWPSSRARDCRAPRPAREPSGSPRGTGSAPRRPRGFSRGPWRLRRGPARTHGGRRTSALQHGEVELADGLLDQAAVVGVVERLARHLLRCHERQVRDLGPDLLERAAGLGLDLAPGLLQPALAIGLGLRLDALALGLGDAPSLGEDLLGVSARLPQQGAVLRELLPRLLARVVRLLQRLADALAALVDRLLDRSE